MAYTQTQAVAPSLTGTAVALTAAPAGGDAVPVGSFLLVNNGGASSITLTLVVGQTFFGYAVTSPTVDVAAGEQLAIGPLPGEPFEQASGTDAGWVHIDYSDVTSVTRAVLKVV